MSKWLVAGFAAVVFSSVSNFAPVGHAANKNAEFFCMADQECGRGCTCEREGTCWCYDELAGDASGECVEDNALAK
jgi:hypothetical protein